MKDDFDPRFWEVDLAAFRVSHIGGFSARLCSLPMTEPDLRELHASGLVAIGTTRDTNGGRWAVLAGSAAIEAGERWCSSRRSPESADHAVTLMAKHAGLAWLRALTPPPTLDSRHGLGPAGPRLR